MSAPNLDRIQSGSRESFSTVSPHSTTTGTQEGRSLSRTSVSPIVSAGLSHSMSFLENLKEPDPIAMHKIESTPPPKGKESAKKVGNCVINFFKDLRTSIVSFANKRKIESAEKDVAKTEKALKIAQENVDKANIRLPADQNKLEEHKKNIEENKKNNGGQDLQTYYQNLYDIEAKGKWDTDAKKLANEELRNANIAHVKASDALSKAKELSS